MKILNELYKDQPNLECDLSLNSDLSLNGNSESVTSAASIVVVDNNDNNNKSVEVTIDNNNNAVTTTTTDTSNDSNKVVVVDNDDSSSINLSKSTTTTTTVTTTAVAIAVENNTTNKDQHNNNNITVATTVVDNNNATVIDTTTITTNTTTNTVDQQQQQQQKGITTTPSTPIDIKTTTSTTTSTTISTATATTVTTPSTPTTPIDSNNNNNNNNNSKYKLERRVYAILEVLESEYKYKKYLEILFKEIMQPIINSSENNNLENLENNNLDNNTNLDNNNTNMESKKLNFTKCNLPTSISKSIFPPDLENILKCSQMFYLELYKKLSTVDQPLKDQKDYKDYNNNNNKLKIYNFLIGDLFLKFIPFFKVYIDYQSHYSFTVHQNLPKVYKNYPLFKEEMDKVKFVNGTDGLDISSLLIMPCQRIVKYNLLINAILKETPPNHPDYPKLEMAFKEMSNTAHTINRKMKDIANLRNLIDIAYTYNIDGLCIPTRRFILSFTMKFLFLKLFIVNIDNKNDQKDYNNGIIEKREFYKIHLLNDCILFTNEKNSILNSIVSSVVNNVVNNVSNYYYNSNNSSGSGGNSGGNNGSGHNSGSYFTNFNNLLNNNYELMKWNDLELINNEKKIFNEEDLKKLLISSGDSNDSNDDSEKMVNVEKKMVVLMNKKKDNFYVGLVCNDVEDKVKLEQELKKLLNK